MGAAALYGARLPRPDAWLALTRRLAATDARVRERTIPAPVSGRWVRSWCRARRAQPALLAGRQGLQSAARHTAARPARFWLVSRRARRGGGLGAALAGRRTCLAWAWQRWELEVAHRELKTSFGLGEVQAWSPLAAVLSVQWTVWAYAVLVLAGMRAWGLGRGTGPGARSLVAQAVAAGRWRGCGRAIARSSGASANFTGFGPGPAANWGK